MRFKADLSKEKNTKDAVTEEVKEQSVVPEESAKLTELGLGVWHNVVTNQFHLVKMKYDPVNKVAGEVEVGEPLSLTEASYYFRIEAGNNFL